MPSKTLPSDRERLGLIGATGLDAPITLQEICDRVFGGAISIASLRVEQKRGNLQIFKIGRRYFSTMRAIEEMRARCLLPVPASAGTIRRNNSESARLADAKAAQMSLALILEARKNRRKTK